MNSSTFQLLWRKKSPLLLTAVVVVLLTMAWSLTQPLRYSSTVKVLVIPKYNPSVDTFVATQSLERLSNSLTSVIETTTFYDYVITAKPEVRAYFDADARDRRKAWSRSVDARIIPDTGLVAITAYHTDVEKAQVMAETVASILVNNGSDFHGAGTDIRISPVDAPLNSLYPVKPNIPKNMIVSILVGLLLGAGYVLYRESDRQSIQNIDIAPDASSVGAPIPSVPLMPVMPSSTVEEKQIAETPAKAVEPEMKKEKVETFIVPPAQPLPVINEKQESAPAEQPSFDAPKIVPEVVMRHSRMFTLHDHVKLLGDENLMDRFSHSYSAS